MDTVLADFFPEIPVCKLRQVHHCHRCNRQLNYKKHALVRTSHHCIWNRFRGILKCKWYNRSYIIRRMNNCGAIKNLFYRLGDNWIRRFHQHNATQKWIIEENLARMGLIWCITIVQLPYLDPITIEQAGNTLRATRKRPNWTVWRIFAFFVGFVVAIRNAIAAQD